MGINFFLEALVFGHTPQSSKYHYNTFCHLLSTFARVYSHFFHPFYKKLLFLKACNVIKKYYKIRVFSFNPLTMIELFVKMFK